jgi:hypothetical protein
MSNALHEEFYLLGYKVMQFAGTEPVLAMSFMLIFCLSYSSTLDMKARCSWDVQVMFQWSAMCYIPRQNPSQRASLNGVLAALAGTFN